MAMGYINLHNHTCYSLLDGLQSTDDLIRWHVERGLGAVAISDHNYLYGILDFYKKAKSAGIKPILGVELSYTPIKSIEELRSLGQEARHHQHHTTIFAKNDKGYRNLVRLASLAATKGMYYVPTYTDDMLRECHEGLVLLSGCPSGPLSQLILQDRYEEALNKARFFHSLLGDDYYIELMLHPITNHPMGPSEYAVRRAEFAAMEQKILKGLQQLSEELSIPAVCTQDAHYTYREQAELHDIVFAMGQGKKVNDLQRYRYACAEFYLKTDEEMAILGFSSDVRNCSVEIAEKCNATIPELEKRQFFMPKYPHVPEGKTEAEYLREQAYKGLQEKGLAHRQEYIDRMEHELYVINKLGWPGYFILLADVIRYCREHNIPTGPSRGSGGASLVNYCMGITRIDPIEHDLLFGRFLSLDRPDPPDVDVDLDAEYRDQVIDYIKDTYGSDNVAQIGTLGLMTTKAAMKKVATAFGVEFEKANKLTSFIPTGEGISVAEALDIPDVQKMYASDPEIKRVIDTAREIENKPSHVGKHAGGVIISPVPLMDICPVRLADGRTVTQWPMEEIAEIGLIKYDFLGLETLTVLRYAQEEVLRNRGIKIDIDSIPLDDPASYELLARADTTGVFQVESSFARSYLVKMKPSKFDDVEAFSALIRPGPVTSPAPSGEGTMVDEFIRRLHGEAPVVYPHPATEAALRDTYGILVYQESLMRITKDMAGFDDVGANQFRSVVAKKKADKMPAQKAKFIEGCIKNGISEAEAEKVFSLMETFANYGFNKCLSADSVVYRASANQYSSREVTVKELYETWGGKTSVGEKYRTRGVKILGLVDGRVRPVRVRNIWDTGVQSVYRITTESGNSLKATVNHRFLTSAGWRRLAELQIGDALYSMGEYETTRRSYSFSGQEQTARGRRHKWDKGYPVYEDKIVSIEYVGEEQTYDLEIETYHNFIANKIVTHNSHSCGYGVLTMQTAYFRTHFYPEFMAALLSSAVGNPDKLTAYLNDCHAHGVKVKAPSINISTDRFVADGKDIRFGLSAIKGVGTAALEAILADRKEHGKYQSFEDFIYRTMHLSAVNKTVMESLARGGAFDEFGLSRKQMAEAIPAITKAISSYKGKIQRINKKNMMLVDDIAEVEQEYAQLEERRAKAEETLRAAISDAIRALDGQRYTIDELTAFEKELLGFYVTNHPLDKYADFYRSLFAYRYPLVNSNNLAEYIGQNIVTCGLVSSVQRKKYSGGWKLDVTLDDWWGSMKVTVFGNRSRQYDKVLTEGNVVKVQGKVIHYASEDITYIKCDYAELAPENFTAPHVMMVFCDSESVFDVKRQIEQLSSKWTQPYDEVPNEHEAYVHLCTGKQEISLPLTVLVKDIEKIRQMVNVHQVLLV